MPHGDTALWPSATRLYDEPRFDDGPPLTGEALRRKANRAAAAALKQLERDVHGPFKPPPKWGDTPRVEYVMPPPKLARHGVRLGVMVLAGGINKGQTWLQECAHKRGYGEGVHAPPLPKPVRFSKWMPYFVALRKESIGLHSAERKLAIIVDIDHSEAYERLMALIADARLPTPSWVVRRKKTGHVHAVWVLSEPIHTGPGARPKPLQAAWRVFEHFTQMLGGDLSYRQLQTHNPVYKDPNNEFEVFWMSKPTHSLKALLTYVPKPTPQEGETQAQAYRRERRALRAQVRQRRRQPRSGSQALFQAGMQWAGCWEHRDLPVLDYLHTLNDASDNPVAEADVERAAEPIEENREAWRTRPEGWHRADYPGRMAGYNRDR